MLKNINKNKITNLNVNFGPQHPAAHGVLRLILNLGNEKILNCDPHIGLLHRGSEHLITTKPFYLSLPYFDRMDYVSMMCQEHCYCLVVEDILSEFKVPSVIYKSRLVLDEITRVLNHLLAIACHALDVGSMSPIFWSFEERENIMEIYEYCSGARMHSAFYRPVFGNKIITKPLCNKIMRFSINLTSSLNEISTILMDNKVWKSRLVGVGLVHKKQINSYGLTGVFSRSVGIKNDLRINKNTSYGFYKYIKFSSFFTRKGDSFNRFVIRMFEMLESVNISVKTLLTLDYLKNNNLIKDFYKFMEGTISSFKLWSGTLKLGNANNYKLIESPKGIFGVFISSTENPNPLKCKVRSPSFNNLLWLKNSAKNSLLADLITLIGTIDVVFGEVDR